MSKPKEPIGQHRLAPKMLTWNDCFPDQTMPYGNQIYITPAILLEGRDFPGLPADYQKAWDEMRVLSVFGIPAHWQTEAIILLFSAFVPCLESPCLVSLEGKTTFRWVVYGSAKDAKVALAKYNGFKTTEDTCFKLTAPYPPHTMVSTVTLELAERLDELFLDSEDMERKLRAIYESKLAKINSERFEVKAPLPKATVAKKKLVATKIGVTRTQSGEIKVTPAVPAINFTGTRDRASSKATEAPIVKQVAVPVAIQPAEPQQEPEQDFEEPKPAYFVPQAVSWANIATAANPKSGTIDLKPRAGRLISKPSQAGPDFDNYEPMVDQMRIVFLFNLPNNITLHDVSTGIKEGPVMKIQFGQDEDTKNKYCGVIFQYARDAELFHQVLSKERVDNQPRRFRFIVDCARGEDPYHADDVIRSMGPPIYATRRLTIVKGHFFEMFGKRHIEAFCDKIVGLENVELIWLYNIGNATIIFADVESATKVKKELDRRAEFAGVPGGESNMWKGLQTTFSKDPCQVPLELKTALEGFSAFV